MYNLVIVEDEIYTCEGLKKLIDWGKYNINIAGAANDGEQGLELIHQTDPDIIIADINMPLLDGLSMIEILRQESYEGEIIILTGHKLFEYAKKAIDNHVDYFLIKPIDEEEMERVIAEIVSRLNNSSNNMSYDENTAKKMVDYVSKHYMDELNLSDLARLFYLDTSNISRYFKKYTGKNYVSYVTEKKMNKACEYLRNSGMSIERISEELKYSSIKYFRRVFKTYVGMSPSEYRKQYKEKVKG